jgi:hypothetical protein
MKKLHNDLIEYKLCGEWFKSSAIDKILEIITERNKASDCSKDAVISLLYCCHLRETALKLSNFH